MTTKTKKTSEAKPKKPEPMIVTAEDRHKYFSNEELYERGWLYNTIVEVLGKSNTIFKIGEYFSTYLYLIDDVLKAEETADLYFKQYKILERGWTKSMIDKLLGDCDEHGKGLYSRQPSKLYLIKRVLAAENTEEFKVLKEKAEKRSKKGIEVANKKRDELMEVVEKMEINVEKMPLDLLNKNARKSYVDFQFYKHGNCIVISDDNDEQSQLFLQRIQVNYIRHHLTQYDTIIAEELFGKVGKNYVWKRFQERIYEKIAEVYPLFKEECERQLQRKFYGYSMSENK